MMLGGERLPFEECPRFDHCSSNKCPLDPEIELRQHIKTYIRTEILFGNFIDF
jgi:hypothetical protein